ncbi:predicted protein [Nematostella vectensis]|uniref:Methyltransferase type 11 domain-containing protein n=1 Tax=Nematostella vectensis TaxID=45351 RepID=A7RKE5_NEMVE|nr:predicted protein [Nematostella vectensis]|eukprot:XP_001640294.1 predicted protein [Nematostella vectensis]
MVKGSQVVLPVHQELHNKAVRAFKKADSYHLIRPKYTPEATEYLLQLTGILTSDHKVASNKPLTILEIGCGTGLLTDTLTKVLKGADNVKIMAADPLESMREVFQKNFKEFMNNSSSPKLEFHACVAEKLPFPDESIDLIVAGASYHWFANQEAYREIARVLVPHGKIAYITNLPNEFSGPVWCQELWKLLWEAYKHSNVSSERADLWRNEMKKSGLFTDVVDDYTKTNFEECDMETCINSFTSYSMVQAGSDEVRRNFEEGFRQVMHEHFTAKGIEFTGIPYQVDIHYCQKK